MRDDSNRAVSGEHVPERVTVALVSGTALYNVAQNVVLPAWTYTPVNGLATGVLLKIADLLGISRTELGASREDLRRGVPRGLLLGSLAVLAVGIAVAWPTTRVVFNDARVVGIGFGAALFEALVRIPIGTALFEETLFRGVLLAWLARRTSQTRAIIVSSVLFGLWHALPTWMLTSLYQDGAIRDSGVVESIGAIAAGVVLTAMVGAWLAWLRLRTNSLATPIIVHAAANSSAYLAAYIVAHWM